MNNLVFCLSLSRCLCYWNHLYRGACTVCHLRPSVHWLTCSHDHHPLLPPLLAVVRHWPWPCAVACTHVRTVCGTAYGRADARFVLMLRCDLCIVICSYRVTIPPNQRTDTLAHERRDDRPTRPNNTTHSQSGEYIFASFLPVHISAVCLMHVWYRCAEKVTACSAARRWRWLFRVVVMCALRMFFLFTHGI